MSYSRVLLTKKQLSKCIKALEGWSVPLKGNVLQKTFTFKDHLSALVFIARLTVHAQVLDHHPDLLFTFKKVKVTLSTHSVKGITGLDIEFAKRAETLKGKSG